MKILCVIDSLCAGGAQRQLVQLALGFKDKGHHVSFLTYHDIPFFQPALNEAGIHISCMGEPAYSKRLIKMRRFIRNGKYDSVLSFLESPNLICELSGIPFRSWKLIVGERSASPRILKSTKHRLLRWFHFFADRIIANSTSNIAMVKKANPLLRSKKLKVIYNTVDFDKNKPFEDYQPRQDGITHMVIAGRLSYPKNLIGLAEALCLLNEEERKLLQIHWYGDREADPQKAGRIDEAFQKIKENKLDEVILFSPSCTDIEDKIRNADVVGLFSIYEGFPNSICEAMACAKPVICSAVSDLPQWIHEPSFLCNPNDPESIKKALQTLIYLNNDELIQIGIRNYHVAREYFSRESIISAYLELLTPSQS
jgi:glycosyltransferase involved in cell wall biosynthesis